MTNARDRLVKVAPQSSAEDRQRRDARAEFVALLETLPIDQLRSFRDAAFRVAGERSAVKRSKVKSAS